jgi:uncharacterized iron-regulated protein
MQPLAAAGRAPRDGDAEARIGDDCRSGRLREPWLPAEMIVMRLVEMGKIALGGAAALALAACAGQAASPPGTAPEATAEFTASSLAERMRRRPVVLLGEIHDNEVQHAMRALALELLLQGGARPALAFEQFDRERQADIDRVRQNANLAAGDRLERLVALGAHGWNWSLYRPYLVLALRYDLPIVAADLSRADAMRVSQQGYAAVFDAPAQARLGLDRLPEELLRAQQKAVDEGHCHQMPEQMLPAIARAQVARDAALAEAIAPYLDRGVVLLAGNGHVRRDMGVPRFLPAEQLARLTSIGLIEQDAAPEAVPPGAYDAVFRTPVQARKDPCEGLQFNAAASVSSRS